ncbi:hypothetical protein D3C78_976120 [compost metagenome]
MRHGERFKRMQVKDTGRNVSLRQRILQRLPQLNKLVSIGRKLKSSLSRLNSSGQTVKQPFAAEGFELSDL